MRSILIYMFILFSIIACKEIYESPAKSPVTGYLVVEGVINSGPGATQIRLSRTTSLDNMVVQHESGASVIIEGEDNSTRILNNSSDGLYEGTDLSLNSNTKYRLKITTLDAKEYVSDYTPVKNNPPIDSISWKRENSGVEENGLQIYVSTHDPQDNTRYYQWEYVETWEYHAVHESRLKYEISNLPSGEKRYEVVYRDPVSNRIDSTLYFCWRNIPSSSILIGSSAKLSKDQIYLPLLYIPKASEKLSVLYSINVRQYSWSKEGYEFLERMRKNTEQTGSVFDAQPSALNGNIHCLTNPEEPVIGFVTICPVQEKRLFISKKEVPDWKYEEIFCPQVILPNNNDSIIAAGLGLIPTNIPPCPGPICPSTIVEFMAAQPKCVDCKVNGGSTIKPPFWPW
jgi:hypothetical protein